MSSDRPDKQLSLDLEEEVFRHLIFHKSLIDDSDEVIYGKLDKYLEVLKNMNEGVHVTIKDSYSKSIAMVLELATEEYLDPWDVDLVRFSRMFLKKLKGQERFNLVVIGKLIRMAYTVHKLKSDNTLRKAEITQEEERFDDDQFYDWMDNDETFEVTRGILQAKKPPIVESVIHKGDRPVTLLDLLNALEEVEDEVSVLQKERKRRIETNRRLEELNMDNINEKVFKEHTDEDIHVTWQEINKFNGHPIPFTDIAQDINLDMESAFISLLYLARDDMIKVWQRSFPKGEIMVKNIGKGKPLKYGDLDENLEKVMEGETEMETPGELIIEEKTIPGNWNT